MIVSSNEEASAKTEMRLLKAMFNRHNGGLFYLGKSNILCYLLGHITTRKRRRSPASFAAALSTIQCNNCR